MNSFNYDKFKKMQPMKYYEPGGLEHSKAKDMIANKNNEFIALEKLDGEWARVIIMEDEILIQSRSISKVTGIYGDKTLHVPHIVEELLEKFSAGTVLLGELGFEDRSKTSRDVGSILRCLPPKAIHRQEKEKLHLFVFDCLADSGIDLTQASFEERFKSVRSSIPYGTKYIFSVKYSEKDFMKMAESCWEKGGEGIVIMRRDSMYNPGGRKSWDSLKVKKKLGEIEAKVVDFIEPKQHYEGSEIASWKYWASADNGEPMEWKNPFGEDYLEMTDGMMYPVTKPYYYGWKNGIVVEYEGRTIKVSSGLTDYDREWLASSAAKEMLDSGKLYAAITGMELTEDSIRHPVLVRLRDDL